MQRGDQRGRLLPLRLPLRHGGLGAVLGGLGRGVGFGEGPEVLAGFREEGLQVDRLLRRSLFIQ